MPISYTIGIKSHKTTQALPHSVKVKSLFDYRQERWELLQEKSRVHEPVAPVIFADVIRAEVCINNLLLPLATNGGIDWEWWPISPVLGW